MDRYIVSSLQEDEGEAYYAIFIWIEYVRTKGEDSHVLLVTPVLFLLEALLSLPGGMRRKEGWK